MNIISFCISQLYGYTVNGKKRSNHTDNRALTPKQSKYPQPLFPDHHAPTITESPDQGQERDSTNELKGPQARQMMCDHALLPMASSSNEKFPPTHDPMAIPEPRSLGGRIQLEGMFLWNLEVNGIMKVQQCDNHTPKNSKFSKKKASHTVAFGISLCSI